MRIKTKKIFGVAKHASTTKISIKKFRLYYRAHPVSVQDTNIKLGCALPLLERNKQY